MVTIHSIDACSTVIARAAGDPAPAIAAADGPLMRRLFSAPLLQMESPIGTRKRIRYDDIDGGVCTALLTGP